MTEAARAALRDLPDTPAGRQMGWYLGMLLAAGEGGSLRDRDHYVPELWNNTATVETDEEVRSNWRATAGRVGEVLAIAIEAESNLITHALLSCAKERKWRVTLSVEPAPPHRIAALGFQRQFDFKLDFREATEADGAILADIERRCPIVMGDTSMYFDRGTDYFAFARLMEDYAIGIASVDGVPAAVSCGTKHTVKVGGVLRPIITVSHLRVLPEHQRKGLWGAANRVLDKYWPTVDGSNAYISIDNAGMQHGFKNTPDKWNVQVLRLQFDCAALRGSAAGRSAVPSDAATIAERINTFHGDEEMFVPYTADSFRRRMERAPAQYSWDKMWMTDRALVGVWPAGDSLRVVTETRGQRSDSVRGVVLDYAFAPGAEREFEQLLRAWCGWLQDRGMDRLSLFTSPTSPGADFLRGLAREVEAFNMWTPGIRVPPGADTRGLYVDPIYF